MKKYLKILPLILYPYAYLIFLICVYSIQTFVKEGQTIDVEIIINLGIVAIVLYNLWVLILSLWSAIGGLKRYTPTEAAKMNLAVKGWQIPAYLFHFLIGAFGSVASVWGIGFVAFAIIIDLVTIFLSGLFAVGCVRRLKKEGLLSAGTAFWAGLGSFIYCVDVIVAIVLAAMCKPKKNRTAVGKAAPPPLPPVPPTSAPAQKETQGETASTNVTSVPPQEQQTTAEAPLPPPLPSVPPTSAPAQNETVSSEAASVPQRKKRQKATERPLPPPFVPTPPKPAPAQKETADETAREE